MATKTFDRFSDPARASLLLADAEAEAMRHPRIGSEHLLLGLLAATDGDAHRILAEAGIELDRCRNAVLLVFGRGKDPSPPERTLTRQTNRILELAIELAYQRSSRQVGTEHILLALLKVDGGRKAGVLDSLGVVAEDLRAKVMDDLRRLKRPEQSLDSVPAPAERAGSAALERLATQEVAELEVSLRAAVKRGDPEEIRRLESALDEAVVRRLDERRRRMTELLVDYQRRRLELETGIAHVEREIERLDAEIERRDGTRTLQRER